MHTKYLAYEVPIGALTDSNVNIKVLNTLMDTEIKERLINPKKKLAIINSISCIVFKESPAFRNKIHLPI